AAAARSVSRAVSHAASVRSEANHERDESAAGEHEQYQPFDDSMLDPSSNASQSQASQEETGEGASADAERVDAGHTPGQALKSAKRPKYLRSRIGSQRSSVSSLLTDADSDVTVGAGADYALQSGGAVPSAGMPRSFNNPLSRS